MQRFLITFFALLLLSIPLVAQSSPTFRVEAPTNVRSGPGTEYTVRATVSSGSLLVTGRNGYNPLRACLDRTTDLDMWLRVDLNGVEGWVARCVGTLNERSSSLPVVSPQFPQLIENQVLRSATVDPALGEAPFPGYLVGRTVGNRVNVRSAPALNASIVNVIQGQVPVFLLSRTADGSWIYVRYDENQLEGWVASYLIDVSGKLAGRLPVAR